MIRLIIEVPALSRSVKLKIEENHKEEKKAPSGRVEALDEVLDLPHLDVLLRYVLTHFGKDDYELVELLETQRLRKRGRRKWRVAALLLIHRKRNVAI